MDPIAHLLLATFAFVATHFMPSTPLRPALVRAIGERSYRGLYSLIAFATLGAMIWAYARAPYEPLWFQMRAVPKLVMPVAFILFACALMSRNPTLVGQEAALKAAEPARGMLRVTRHPLMWSFMLWAAAHTLARGDAASLIFFGGFFLVAALGTLLIDRRKAATLGEDWRRFAAVTSNLPFAAIVARRNRLSLTEIGWIKPGVGLLLCALSFAFHPWLFGSRPF